MNTSTITLNSSVTLTSSIIRSINVILNPNCHKQVRDEHLKFLTKELWDLYAPKYFPIMKESKKEVTLYVGGLHERTWDVTIPCENCEITYKFYNEMRGGHWCFLSRSIIVKTGRGILVL